MKNSENELNFNKVKIENMKKKKFYAILGNQMEFNDNNTETSQLIKHRTRKENEKQKTEIFLDRRANYGQKQKKLQKQKF